MQALAMLDAVICPEWEHRYHSFDAGWHTGEGMGSVRTGSGDDLFTLFNAAGCFIKAFEHETWPPNDPADFYRGVPVAFQDATAEPAFSLHHVTLCCWRTMYGPDWEGWGKPGSYLLDGLDGRPETYKEFAAEYFEADIALADVAAVFAHAPLAPALMHRLNPAADSTPVLNDAAGIGYPTG